MNITDLTGLEYVTNLEVFVALRNNIRNIRPLVHLTNPSFYDLGSNQIVDVSPLARLINLDLVIVANLFGSSQE